MTTKTDFHAIQELREKYTPKLMDEKSGEFEAGDGNQNMVTFEVSE